jgi:hypothetical protein
MPLQIQPAWLDPGHTSELAAPHEVDVYTSLFTLQSAPHSCFAFTKPGCFGSQVSPAAMSIIPSPHGFATHLPCVQSWSAAQWAARRHSLQLPAPSQYPAEHAVFAGLGVSAQAPVAAVHDAE